MNKLEQRKTAIKRIIANLIIGTFIVFCCLLIHLAISMFFTADDDVSRDFFIITNFAITLSMGFIGVSIVLLIVLLVVLLTMSRQSSETSADSPLTLPDNQRLPRFAAYLLCFLPRTQRAALLGDLEEEYWEIHDQRGRRQAGIWYWGQTITSLGPLLWRAVCTLLRENMPGWFGAIIRRFIP